MTSHALSLTVVVVDPRRLALVCRKNGGKQAGKPAGQKRYWKMNVIKTRSLTVVTEENVPGASFTLKTPNLFTATSRQLEM